MRKYLVLENDQEFVDGTYRPYQRDNSSGESAFELVFVKTVDEANQALAFGRFNGAILDLRLSDSEEAEGNEVASKIHRDYFMPIAVVTGFQDELASEMRQLAEGGTSFVRLFNKNEMIGAVFDFLFKVEQSGVLQIVGPGGEMNQLLSEIFWKHLGPVIKQWEGQTLSPMDRKRLLRHAVAHMVGALQSHAPGTWDTYLPSEVYFWPPICQNEMTGDIYVQLETGQETRNFVLLVTPACDLASKDRPGAVRHFVRILPFSSFPNEGKAAGLVAKKELRYHVLPPSASFDGGVADFASISCIPAADANSQYARKGSIIEPFWREIVTRLGVWLSRQGTPEIERELLMQLIRKQWPSSPAPQAAAK